MRYKPSLHTFSPSPAESAHSTQNTIHSLAVAASSGGRDHDHAVLNYRPMDPREAAAYLHLDDKTVTRWARLGYIPAHPLGQGKKKYWRFHKHELDTWLNAQSNGAMAA